MDAELKDEASKKITATSTSVSGTVEYFYCCCGVVDVCISKFTATFSASLKSSLTSEANLYENSSMLHSLQRFVGYGTDVRRKIEGENIVLGCSAISYTLNVHKR